MHFLPSWPGVLGFPMRAAGRASEKSPTAPDLPRRLPESSCLTGQCGRSAFQQARFRTGERRQVSAIRDCASVQVETIHMTFDIDVISDPPFGKCAGHGSPSGWAVSLRPPRFLHASWGIYPGMSLGTSGAAPSHISFFGLNILGVSLPVLVRRDAAGPWDLHRGAPLLWRLLCDCSPFRRVATNGVRRGRPQPASQEHRDRFPGSPIVLVRTGALPRPDGPWAGAGWVEGRPGAPSRTSPNGATSQRPIGEGRPRLAVVRGCEAIRRFSSDKCIGKCMEEG